MDFGGGGGEKFKTSTVVGTVRCGAVRWGKSILA